MKLGFEDERILNNGRDFYACRVMPGIVALVWYLDDPTMSMCFYYHPDERDLTFQSIRGMSPHRNFDRASTWLEVDCPLQAQAVILNFIQKYSSTEVTQNVEAD